MYRPGGDVTSWGTPPPLPSVNGIGLVTPSYMQGYYGSNGGLPPPMYQQTLLQPLPNLPVPRNLEQSVQYLGFSSPLSAAASTMLSSSSGADHVNASSPLPSLTMPSNLPLAQLSLQKTAAGPEVFTDSMTAGSTFSAPLGTAFSSFPFPPSVIPQQDVNATIPTFSLEPTTVSGSTAGATQPATSLSVALKISMLNLATPGHFALSVPYNAIQLSPNISTRPSAVEREDKEDFKVSSSLPLDAAEGPVASPAPGLPSPELTRGVPKVFMRLFFFIWLILVNVRFSLGCMGELLIVTMTTDTLV